MKRIEIAALCGILLSIALSSLSVFADDCEALHTEVLRLHIIANSDSPEDQALKLKVRDRILAETGDLFSAEKNLDAAKRDAAASLNRLCRLAEDELSENGCDDPVFAEVCRMWFDTRFYGDYTLPAGTYDAVRLTIGKAEGKNWWCVLFPPLCVNSAMDEKELKEILSESGETLVKGGESFRVKFYLVELLEKLFHKERV